MTSTLSEPSSVSSVAPVEEEGTAARHVDALPSTLNFSFSEFLARPVLIQTYTGTGAIGLPPIEPYAADFFASPAVLSKLQYFSYVRGNFVLRVYMTTSAYAMGKFVFSAFMGPYATTISPILSPALIAASFTTMHHVLLDCATCNTAALRVPFQGRYPYHSQANTAINDWVPNFVYGLASLTPILSSLDGSNAPYTIRVFASLEDADISTPTPSGVSYTLGSYTSKRMDRGRNRSSEQQMTQGSISYPASIVASAAGLLTRIPVIAPFARVGQIVAQGVADIAKLFGFSKPTSLDDACYPHEEQYATYSGPLRSKVLTLDPQAEVLIDASMLGQHVDPLAFDNLLTIEGLLTSFDWQSSGGTGSLIYTFPVTPCYSEYQDATYPSVFAPTPLTYVSQLFQGWRGTMVYRIDIPANRYVRGKVRVFWSQIQYTSDLTTDQFTNVCQNAASTLIDLTQTTQVEVSIGYAGSSPYLPCFLMSPGTQIAQQVSGFLHFVVEEQLTMPAEGTNVTVLVFQRAEEGFDFCIPTTNRMASLHRQPWNGSWAGESFSSSGVWYYNDQYNMPSQLNNPYVGAPDDYYLTNFTSSLTPRRGTETESMMSITQVLLDSAPSADVDSTYMGERFASLRPLLKRFFFYVSTNDLDSAQPLRVFLPYLPWEPYPNGASGSVDPGAMTPLRYVSNMFRGVRGAIRYRLAPWSTPLFEAIPQQVTIRREYGRIFNVRNIVNYSGPAITSDRLFSGSGEASYQVAMGEPVFVDVPYQFASAYQSTEFYNSQPDQAPTQPGFSMLFMSGLSGGGSSTPSLNAYDIGVAAGEDFNPVIWNGVPVLSSYTIGN